MHYFTYVQFVMPKSLLQVAHPDKAKGLVKSEHAFGLVKKAFDVLNNQDQKRQFDMLRNREMRNAAMAGGGQELGGQELGGQ